MGNLSNSLSRWTSSTLPSKDEKKRKKKSLSTIKRNARRLQEFLDKKNSLSARSASGNVKDTPENTSDVDKDDSRQQTIFKCDHCDFSSKSTRLLKTHREKKHKVPQMDGNDDGDEEDFTSVGDEKKEE